MMYASSKRFRRRRLDSLWLIVPGALILFFLLICGIGACSAAMTSEERARESLQGFGFSAIHYEGREWLFIQLKGCGEDDSALYRYSATNAAGDRVKVSVCEGIFKGATVRGTN